MKFTYKDLEEKTTSELLDLKEKCLVELNKIAQKRNELIVNILCLQETIELEESRL